ncbi:hypothetical protein M8998_04145 [Sphingobacterium sp. lm-10]|uniref:hypothetical protein n=1 Tax=Sphingobacterium sp. lm-10 TaxID=2944904 RepID=UPI00202203B2|nr:hypothetical protein [Sphingobacterium sp. lm-10]MCL7987130.1 hypothetical protein [Sphingobacterium sp. lm-10]
MMMSNQPVKHLSRYFSTLLLLIAVCSTSANAQTADNEEILMMYQADQASRLSPDTDWTLLAKQDSLRRIRAYELIDSGLLTTGNDYHHAAMIFQHGLDSVDYGKAVDLMRKALELDSTINKWLLAAAIDRELMSKEQPQIFGTQYRREGDRMVRYKIDTTQISPEERAAHGVRSLAEQLVVEREFNLIPISSYHRTAESLEQTMSFIEQEREKGDTSRFNVGENGLRHFADQLMQKGDNEGAARVQQLQKALYPTAVNEEDCHCPENKYAPSKANQVFTFSNGQKIVACGFVLNHGAFLELSEFVLAECDSDHIIDFWDAMRSCRLSFSRDTLLIEDLYTLPLGDNLQETVITWAREYISYDHGVLKRDKAINRNLKLYDQSTIQAVLKAYESTDNILNDAKMGLLDRLFVAAISNSEEAKVAFMQFRGRFPELDGAYLHQYRILQEMLTAWDGVDRP